MRLLIDSSGPLLVCGLAEEGSERVVAEIAETPQQGSAIDGIVSALLGHCTIADIYSIAVGVGPGSFIGTRTAISFANGLAVAAGIPVHGVSSLAAIAAAHGTPEPPVLRDARRGQWYVWMLGTECVARDEAGAVESLVQAGHTSAVIEWIAGDEPALAGMLRTAGVTIDYSKGVTAEGLLRAMVASEPQEYVEPIYLRGFT